MVLPLFYNLVIWTYNSLTLEIGDMMTKKINAKNIVVLGLSGTVLGTLFGAIGTYPLQVFWPHYQINAWLNISLVLSSLYGPLAYAVFDSLHNELGVKSTTSIIGQSLGGRGRKIPFKADGKDQKDIFMLSVGTGDKVNEVVEMDSITVSIDDNNYTVSLSNLEYFIRKGWARQRQRLSAFSRRYWMKNERLSTVEYQTRMSILLSIDGLIVDRGERRSGRLAIPPSATMEAITSTLL